METFRNPPITEALIDIRAELGSDITLSDLEKLHESIKSHYPKKQLRHRWEGVIEFKGAEGARAQSKDLGPDGYFFWSEDDKQAVQFRLDGFTFNRLRPYKDWPAMRTDAKPLWELYVANAKPLRVTRLALRYINSIDIPEKSFLLENYFTAPPKVPEGLSQSIEQFLSRIEINFPELDAKAIITQTVQPQKSPEVTSILFDLDVFRFVSLRGDQPEIWQILSDLRDLKNDIFDKSLTEKTKELFR
jgi:uncharacterized protein (TIGR04255 family)